MSPIRDPRFSHARWEETLKKDRDVSDRRGRLEYIKPTVILAAGGGAVMAIIALFGGGETDELSGPVSAAIYPVLLAIQLVFGVAGLWAASSLWLGGAGPLGLAVLRLAGIYAATDLVGYLVAPLAFVGWLIQIVCYLILLGWLFELDFGETVALALITFLLKLAGGTVIAVILSGVL